MTNLAPILSPNSNRRIFLYPGDLKRPKRFEKCSLIELRIEANFILREFGVNSKLRVDQSF